MNNGRGKEEEGEKMIMNVERSIPGTTKKNTSARHVTSVTHDNPSRSPENTLIYHLLDGNIKIMYLNYLVMKPICTSSTIYGNLPVFPP